MEDRYSVVITTINYPTRAVTEIARDAHILNADVILIGDEKSPSDFRQDGARYMDLEAQRGTGFEYAKIAPVRHYARKNIGYLAAIEAGATVIIETDDDNIPDDQFWTLRHSEVKAPVINEQRWINIYSYFGSGQIWPRGLPLDEVLTPAPSLEDYSEASVFCPIQQSLADENPDVDAIYRLICPLPLRFLQRPPVILTDGAWCPFNSQNTTWWPAAYPLLYLPYYCSFRMTDIWRSFVAQRILYLNGWGLSFHSASVKQERNEHDLMRDFADEIPGYLHNREIRLALNSLPLEKGIEEIPNNIRRCYEMFVNRGWVGGDELRLVEAWLRDVRRLAF